MERESLDSAQILVVDDEEDIRKVLQEGIKHEGYECFVAGNAKEGLYVFDDKHVDLVITDIRMPGLSGIDFGQIVRQKYHCDVIIMTGYVDDFSYENVMGKGASDFIQKPVGIEELILRVKRVLRERAVLKERDQAMKELKQSLNKVKRTMHGVVQAMAFAVETRDPYTAGHQTAVAGLGGAIATYLCLSNDQIKGVSMAGLIHDIGKISIPAEILNKPGPLTEGEFNLIKNHPQVGYDILKGIEFPWPIGQIVLQHHERMDGSGYPSGLSSEETLLEAKILAVADVVEAMASNRPYRPGLGIDKALEELSLKRNILYDPNAVDACMTLFVDKAFKLEEQKKSLDVDDRD